MATGQARPGPWQKLGDSASVLKLSKKEAAASRIVNRGRGLRGFRKRAEAAGIFEIALCSSIVSIFE